MNTVCSPCLRGHHDNCTTSSCTCTECHPPVVMWEEPPGSPRGRAAKCPLTADQLDELRANPGRWARIHTYDRHTSASSAARRIQKGTYPEMPEGHWEATGRRDGAGSVLYARYVGAGRLASVPREAS